MICSPPPKHIICRAENPYRTHDQTTVIHRWTINLLRRRPKDKDLNYQQIHARKTVYKYTPDPWHSPRSPSQIAGTAWKIGFLGVEIVGLGECLDGASRSSPEEEGAGYEVGGVEAG